MIKENGQKIGMDLKCIGGESMFELIYTTNIGLILYGIVMYNIGWWTSRLYNKYLTNKN